MSSSNFIDYVKLCSRSGEGGAGYRHFHRNKSTSKGGPDGGDGGRGGHVILRCNAQLWTLLHLKYRKHIIAQNGCSGEEKNRTGADGKDVVIEVPQGTIAVQADTGEKICEITEDGKEIVLTPGGRGGKGNTFFANSVNRTPQYAQPGEPGKEEWIILELKLLADVGLIGLPNAGKSTLLSTLSAAKPKIADYPFTTLTPNLGVVYYHDDLSFVMADIPGIIKGAAKGKGLGTRFLRHIERNAALLFLVPVDSPNIKAEYQMLLNELEQYNPELLDKKRILALSKSDVAHDTLKAEIKKKIPKDVHSIFISSTIHQGINELKDLIWKNLETKRKQRVP